MLLHDRFNGRQAKPTAAWLGRKTSFKYSVPNALGDPGSVIFNFDLNVPTGRKFGGRQAALVHILGAHQKLANFRSGFAGVDHHVLNDLRELNGIADDWIQVRLKGKVRFELGAAEGEMDRMSKNFRDVERLLDRCTALRKREQSSGEAGRAPGPLPGVVEILRQLFIELCGGGRQIQIGNNYLKNIVEIVGDAAGQRSDELEALSTEFRFHLPFFGNVGVDHQNRARVSLIVA